MTLIYEGKEPEQEVDMKNENSDEDSEGYLFNLFEFLVKLKKQKRLLPAKRLWWNLKRRSVNLKKSFQKETMKVW